MLPKVLRFVGAVALVDDSLDNALSCVLDKQPVRVLLFGDYEWNKRSSTMHEDPNSFDMLSYDERQKLGLSPDLENYGNLPAGIDRVRDWPAVVEMARSL
jgi:hypothetical protein